MNHPLTKISTVIASDIVEDDHMMVGGNTYRVGRRQRVDNQIELSLYSINGPAQIIDMSVEAEASFIIHNQ